MATNFLFAQSETVRKKLLPKWHQVPWNVLTDLIERNGEEERIGERDFRIPVDTEEGGRFGVYNPASGDMGRGTAPKGNVMTGSYRNFRLNFEIDFLSRKVTEGKASLKKPFKDMVANGMQIFADYIDRSFHGSGSAVLATATAHAASGGKSTYTLANTVGAALLKRGQYVQAYANDLSAVKGDPLVIETIDYNTRKVKLSGTPTGAANDDQICIDGVSGASPLGLRGLYYWNSYATSGTTAGVDRAVEPEIIANSVDGSGGLTYEKGLRLFDKIFTRYRKVPEGLTGVWNTNARATALKDVMSLQTFDISGGSKYLDRLPEGFRDPKRTMPWCGVPHVLDANQDQTRVDWMVPKLFGRAILDTMKFYEQEGGQRFFALYGTSGAPAAATWFGLTVDMDFYCTQPGMLGVIYSVPIDPLYA